MGARSFLLLRLFFEALAADFGKPHPHRETRAPFAADSKIAPVLDSEDLATLARGEVVLKQSRGSSRGVGVAVEDVAAPPNVVWGQLLDFGSYASKVPRIKVCENYEVSGCELKTRFVVQACPGYSVEYFVRHVYAPHANALVWTLDYDRKSDLDDVHGIWRVTAHPTHSGWSRVEYSADLRLKLGVPGFIVDTLTKKALREACSWVKLASEKDFANSGAKHRGLHPNLLGSAAARLDASLREFEAVVVDVASKLRKHSQAVLVGDVSRL